MLDKIRSGRVCVILGVLLAMREGEGVAASDASLAYENVPQFNVAGTRCTNGVVVGPRGARSGAAPSTERKLVKGTMAVEQRLGFKTHDLAGFP